MRICVRAASRVSLLMLALTIGSGSALVSQTDAAKTGKVERIKVHGKSLEGNLIGDPADRNVSIYLPPGYQRSRTARYPVVYMLHGYTDSDAKLNGIANLKAPHCEPALAVSRYFSSQVRTSR